MTWLTEVQKGLFNAGQEVQSKYNQFTDTISSLSGGLSATVGGMLTGSDVVGINANEIPAMRESIRTYVSGLEQHLEEVKVNADTSNAYKGEYAAAIKEYVAAITEACKAVTSQLLAFSDQLKEIEEAYAKQDTEISSKINSSKSSVESMHSKYTEKY